ncbi:MAG: hypothetical protein ACFFDH_00600 [Promethearchaeota archaeon]
MKVFLKGFYSRVDENILKKFKFISFENDIKFQAAVQEAFEMFIKKKMEEGKKKCKKK